MTTDQFLFKARQSRLIQWLKSGKVEYIYMTKEGKVLAKDILGRIHHIVIKNKKHWFCRMVKEGEYLRLGDLI